MMAFLQNFWWYLVLIGVMILFHELGHYWAALLCDVKVETFSFGFGPRLFGFRRGETDFRFSAILFGGYVKMAGDQPGDEAAADPRSLFSKPRYQRMFIAFAGPLINLVLAVAILAGLFMVEFPKIPMPHSPIVGSVVKDGAADKAGIREGDQIVQIGNTVSPTWDDITLKEIASARRPLDVWAMRDGQRMHFAVTPAYDEKQSAGNAGWEQETEVEVASYYSGVDVAQKAGLEKGDILVSVNGLPIRSRSRLREVIEKTKAAPVELTYSRQGQKHEVTITPARREVDGEERWMIGVELGTRVEIVKLPFPQAVSESVKRNAQSATVLLQVLESIVERRMSPKSLEGPLRIAQISGEAAREGWKTFLGLMAAVSLQLAIINLVPIPIFDGGVILMLFVEMLMRRDLDLKVKEAVIRVGFVFLMVVLVFVIYNDLSKILPPG
jgi:regulator of sigma E protease